MREVCGTHGVGVKSVDTMGNTKSEGSTLAHSWRWDTKAWVANGIRYPSSPRPKRWSLAFRSIDPLRGEANALSDPPGEYGRKAKTQRNRRGLAQAVDYVAQFDDKRRTLPRLETQTKSSGNITRLTRAAGQVLHGRRQFVVWIVPLSGVTNATLIACYTCQARLPPICAQSAQ